MCSILPNPNEMMTPFEWFCHDKYQQYVEECFAAAGSVVQKEVSKQQYVTINMAYLEAEFMVRELKELDQTWEGHDRN
tara:strand:+ start:2487 stop:2720 length:234 start_codon:yes stop_codon:yes gene_type:complete